MKQKIRAFGVAFFCTLLLAGLLCGFAVADINTRGTGYGDFAPFARVSAETAPLTYDIAFFGVEYELSLKWLPQAASCAKKAQAFIPVRYKAYAMAVTYSVLGATRELS